MPRINVEDSLWADPRFQEFMIKIGNRHTAKGMVLELWSLTQKHWLTSRGQGIPKPVWKAFGLSDLIVECGLARENGDFFYAIGSKDQFAWLNACSRNGKSGGPAAAKSRLENTGKLNRRKSSRIVENRQDTTSSSFSSSLSFSNSSSASISKKGKGSTSVEVAEHPLLKIWNLNRGTLPAARGLGSSRSKLADARWQENPRQEYWSEVVYLMAKSSFCRGEKNNPEGTHRNWKADIDFLLRPDTHLRVMEGKYDDRHSVDPAKAAQLAEIDAYMKAQGIPLD